MSAPEEQLNKRVARITEYLTRAHRYGKPSILFALYLSEFTRRDAQRMIEVALKDNELSVVDVDAGRNRDLPAFFSSNVSDSTVFLVHNMEQGFPEALNFLNFKREELVEQKVKVVFWVTEKELARISLEAPDFFAFRNRVVEFTELPLTEERRPELIEFALETEYRTLEEIKSSIELKEKLLTELSGEDEVSSYLLGSLGILYDQLGMYRKSIECSEKALDIARRIGDRGSEGAWLGNLGLVYSDLGQAEKAIEYYEQALAISREIGDRRGEGNHLGNLGNAYSHFGQVEKAIEYYEKALAISHEIGDRRGEGADLGNLGNAYSHLGQVEKAIEYYEKALAISREIGDRRGEGNRLNNLGVALKKIKKYKGAIACCLLARKIYEELKDPNIRTTESNLNELEEILGKKQFENLKKEVEQVKDKIVLELLERH
ncbi:MAG TPA: tetratricopeptide repeat protein [Candidatus Methanoperedenaceae archaeon]|nr:tetratricopeptide repeat protein [Candidatus Methanoperedenaceae archaeon]